MPTQQNMDQDLVLKLNITYQKDSTGHWPSTSYPETVGVSINAVEFRWRPVAYYADSVGYRNLLDTDPIKSVNEETRTVNWMRLPPDKDKVTTSYTVNFDSNNFKDLITKQDSGNLQLFLQFYMSGGNIPENPTEDELLYRFNYSSTEGIWITPATNAVFHQSLGAMDNPSLTIIK